MIRLIIPIVSGILYRMGGSDKPYLWVKFFNYRAMIGIPIAITFCIITHSWIPAICILTYWFQPPYGEHSYLNFLGEAGKFAFCGFVFGLSSLPVWIAMGNWGIGLLQAIIGALFFWFIWVLDENGKLKNPWVELLRGFFGTITL